MRADACRIGNRDIQCREDFAGEGGNCPGRVVGVFFLTFQNAQPNFIMVNTVNTKSKLTAVFLLLASSVAPVAEAQILLDYNIDVSQSDVNELESLSVDTISGVFEAFLLHQSASSNKSQLSNQMALTITYNLIVRPGLQIAVKSFDGGGLATVTKGSRATYNATVSRYKMRPNGSLAKVNIGSLGFTVNPPFNGALNLHKDVSVRKSYWSACSDGVTPVKLQVVYTVSAKTKSRAPTDSVSYIATGVADTNPDRFVQRFQLIERPCQ